MNEITTVVFMLVVCAAGVGVYLWRKEEEPPPAELEKAKEMLELQEAQEWASIGVSLDDEPVKIAPAPKPVELWLLGYGLYEYSVISTSLGWKTKAFTSRKEAQDYLEKIQRCFEPFKDMRVKFKYEITQQQ